jgi:hypothetical protein
MDITEIRPQNPSKIFSVSRNVSIFRKLLSQLIRQVCNGLLIGIIRCFTICVYFVISIRYTIPASTGCYMRNDHLTKR